jgi:hypothetical protein
MITASRTGHLDLRHEAKLQLAQRKKEELDGPIGLPAVRELGGLCEVCWMAAALLYSGSGGHSVGGGTSDAIAARAVRSEIKADLFGSSLFLRKELVCVVAVHHFQAR